MKTSNKIILISLAALGGLVVTAAVISRVLIGAGLDQADRGAATVHTENFKDFTAIEASAEWELHVSRGDSYAVTLSINKNAERNLIIRREGDTLVLGQRRPGWGARPGSSWRADITMPAIDRLDFSGVGSVTLSGFSGGRLRVSSSGAGEVKCRDSSFENVSISLSGVGSVDFSDARTVNADVDLSGLGSLKLRMDGGELRGDMSGLGSIEYTGTVSAERISKTGLGSVEHKYTQ